MSAIHMIGHGPVCKCITKIRAKTGLRNNGQLSNHRMTLEGGGMMKATEVATTQMIIGENMCRSIKQLRDAEIPATDEEIRAAALQFVRKVSGYRKPSKVNEAAFERAVEAVAETTRKLLEGLAINKAVQP